MRLILLFFVAVTLLAITGWSQDAEREPGIYARFDTGQGEITARLNYELTPLTALNFISLAEGTGKSTTRDGKFYDGLMFHRCIDNFMIQGGCPQGTGTGDPGYKFRDEFVPILKHSGQGILSMANSGPGTNGSQFFITHVATPHLDGKHTVWGHTVAGAENIAKVTKGTKIKSVTIERVGARAKAFKTGASDWLATEAAVAAVQSGKVAEPDWNQTIELAFPAASKDADGLYSWTTKAGAGEVPAADATVRVHYRTWALGGKKILWDSTSQNPSSLDLNNKNVIPAQRLVLAKMRPGETRMIVAAPKQAYGALKIGRLQPNSSLVIELTLVAN